MANEIEIKFNPNVLAETSDSGLNIYTPGGWSVGINIVDACKYADNYNTDQSSTGGFKEVGDEVIFTHNQSKITLSKPEAKSIQDLIKTAREEKYWS